MLSGGVLTAYVGITGLVQRMAYDRCFPDFLLAQSRFRPTNHNIIFGYFLVAASLCILLRADTETLDSVYAFSFLALMAVFALGLVMLKYKRPEMPREYEASWSTVVFGFLGVSTAFMVTLYLLSRTLLAIH